MSREEQIRGAARGRTANNDSVADNRAEAIDLGTELDLDGLAGAELGLSLFGVGDERRIGRDVGARRDGARVRDTLGDALALEYLGDFIVEELVALLADLNDLGAFGAPS